MYGQAIEHVQSRYSVRDATLSSQRVSAAFVWRGAVLALAVGALAGYFTATWLMGMAVF